MVTKLVQKHLLKGVQKFEIVDDAVNVNIKTPFKEESFTVMLAVLNPEPVIGKSQLEFTSRVNNEALLTLSLAKPNAQEFNDFINILKQKALDEFKSFAGLKAEPSPGLRGNIYDKPPEFDESENTNSPSNRKPVNTEEVKNSIRMLRDYVGGDEINSLLSALEALLAEPQNDEIRSRVFKEFEALGPGQGAVLTYAPYVGILMQGDPYDSF